MSSPEDISRNIHAYQDSWKLIENQRAAESANDISREEHENLLRSALDGLQKRVAKEDEVLQELRDSQNPLELPHPNLESINRLTQIRRAIQAYKILNGQNPELPERDSPVQGLLALREASRLIPQLKTTIRTTTEDLITNRQRLSTEERNLRDAKAILTELKDRVDILQAKRKEEEEDREGNRKRNPDRRAKELIEQQRQKNIQLATKTEDLKRELKIFIDEHLAPMVAAEDLGGPVVGDELEVADTTLEAGYTARGKVKKSAKKSAEEGNTEPGQQRIDELVHRRRRGRGESDAHTTPRPTNRRETAAAEMHALIDSLLHEAGTSSYIELDEDSAASRFLVKAKIAQFHPRDSRRLRLIDVAREIAPWV